MKLTPSPSTRRWLLSLAGGLLSVTLASTVSAQSTAAPPAPNAAVTGDVDNDGVPNASDPDMDGDGVLNANDPDIDGDGVSNLDESETEKDVVLLSPFEVTTTESEGYVAQSSLAGSRLNTSLRDISSPISVITPQFLEDTQAHKVEDLLVYTTSTEVAGVEGNFYGSDATNVNFARTQLLRPQSQTRVRGLTGADITRDFWTTDVPLDTYNVSGVEIQRGPNSILYGLGSPAGIVNYTLKAPLMSDNPRSVEFSANSHGGARMTIDVNQPVVAGVYAIRVNALGENDRFMQKGKYERNLRSTISQRWTPKLAKGIFTQVTANIEVGREKANRPNLTPPADYISSWYTVLNKYTPPDEFFAEDPVTLAYLTPFNGAGNGNWFDQHGIIFGDPNSTAVGGAGVAEVIRQRGGGPFGQFQGVANVVENSINPLHRLGQKSHYANNPAALEIINAMEASSGQPFTGFSNWQLQQVLNTDTFDFWEDDIAGPNNTTWNRFNVYNISFAQTYFENTLGFETVFDRQNYRDGFDRYVNDPTRVGIDINRFVRSAQRADGSIAPPVLNPNYGRPYLASGTAAQQNEITRDAARLTAFYKLNLAEMLNRESLLTRIVGEQTFTGVLSRQRSHHFSMDWQLYGIGEGFGPYSGEDFIGLHYLGSAGNPLIASSPAGLGITGLRAVHLPPGRVSVQLLDQRSSGSSNVLPNVPQFSTVADLDSLRAPQDRNRLFTGGSDNKVEVKTNAFIWQSRLFSDSVVGLFGYRKDDLNKREKSTALRRLPPDARNNPGSVEGRVNPLDPLWAYSPALNQDISETARTYGIMLHSPGFINERLPWGTKISIGYNQAQNVNPTNVGFDVFRSEIPPSSGQSKDYNLLISTLHDKLTFRITSYKSSQQFAAGPGPTIGNIGDSLQRTLNGLMVEASYRGNVRINTTPEFIVNKWFFGGTGASPFFTPGSWQNGTAAQRAALLSQPLQVRTAAATWGDPTTHLNSAGQVMGQPSISNEELLYRQAWFWARSDAEWFRPLGAVGDKLKAAFDYRRVGNSSTPAVDGFTWTRTNVPSFRNTTDIETKGLEFEVTANVTPNWRVAVNAARTEAENANVLSASMHEYYAAMSAIAMDGYTPNDLRSAGSNWANGSDYWHRTGFAHIDEWGAESSSNVDANLNADNHQMFGEKWVSRATGGFGVGEDYINAVAADGRAIRELRKWRFNAVTNYDFKEGRFKGFGIGGSVRYQSSIVLGFYPRFDETGIWVSDLDKPISGPSEVNFDSWISYRRKLTEKIDMKVQLNVRNLFAGKELIPILPDPDGTIGQYRLGPTTNWGLSTRFDF